MSLPSEPRYAGPVLRAHHAAITDARLVSLGPGHRLSLYGFSLRLTYGFSPVAPHAAHATTPPQDPHNRVGFGFTALARCGLNCLQERHNTLPQQPNFVTTTHS